MPRLLFNSVALSCSLAGNVSPQRFLVASQYQYINIHLFKYKFVKFGCQGKIWFRYTTDSVRKQWRLPENESRLYQWVENGPVPADNNLAERDLVPSVVARKISFGSITYNEARTRSVLTSLVTTLRKRKTDVADQIKRALDHLVQDMDQDPYNLLFSIPGP